MVPLSTTVTLELATDWPIRAGESRSSLAVEVGFEPVPYRFVKQDAGPAGAEHDFHFAGRSGHCAELQNGAAGGFAGEIFRTFGVDETGLARRGRRRLWSPWWCWPPSLAITNTLRRQRG